MADRATDNCLTIAGTCLAIVVAIVGYQWRSPDGWLKTTVVRQRDLGVQYQKAQKPRPALARTQTPAKANEISADTEAVTEEAPDTATQTPR
jgi:hypothetical protein